ncbi:MAG: PQQ-like beta-propeller repeat protein, partial [Acidobacteria bacterium]|nr:PQQ-like beta-propeller repeat protein [Acidobacteriota bacterium]
MPKSSTPALAMAFLLAGSTVAKADEEDFRRTLEMRSEAPAQEAVQRTDLAGVPAGVQLFFMTGPDNSPVVRSLPDMNGDGIGEVLVGIDESGVDNVFCLDGTSSGAATVVWSLETMDGVSGGSPYGDLSLSVVPDTDGNGLADVLAGTAWGGRTAYRLDGGSGEIQWRFDTYLEADSGWVYSLTEVGDITNDGKPEVAFGAGSDNDRVYLVDGASDATGQAAVRWRYLAPDAVLSVVGPGDLDGDGEGDVVAAVGDFGDVIVALSGSTTNPNGTVIWQFPSPETPFALEVLPDITGDGVAEILAAVWVNNGSAVRALNGATGTQVWQSTTVLGLGMLVDLLPDVTGDGVPEVVASSWENAVSLLSGADGTQVWKTPVGTVNGGDVWSARGIGDLNGDTVPDVIAGSFDYHVYAMSGTDGSMLWAFDTGNRVFSVHPLEDLNGDGRPDVAVGTQDTNNNVVVHVLDGAAGNPGPFFADGFETG